ncbi:MAG: RdgB/HAM1 family non-canonical purine NTP pyrophosphatase [Alphaproteobacteria bacterium]|jgi:XTP/dITP diphosphohydrolase|nr:RdgB/HAM1 family non-canonical purine NTP pyrophosphatase [Alphaproteobacteria bacterium]
MKLLFASHNKNKLKELKYLLEDFKIEIFSSSDFNLEEPIEDGLSFEDNALIKARQSAQQTGLLSLSDDSGFEVEAIDNQPSIYSARWAIDGNYEVAFNRIQKLLSEANDKLKQQGLESNNKARFVSVLCLYNPETNTHNFFRGEIEGSVVFPPAGNNGFAYDSIFIPQGYDKTFAELSFEEKNTIAHRYRALQKLKAYFKETL